jgi:cysteine desulfurase
MAKIYLDYAATTPTDKRVIAAMLPYFREHFGNPSSLHSYGQKAKMAIEEARKKVANLIGAEPEEIVFTSGGTEANNFVLKGTVYTFVNNQKNHNLQIITSKIEHHSVLEPCKFLEKQGFKVVYLPVDEYGLVDLEKLEKSLTPETILVSIMFANNEVGTIQPIKEIAEIVKNFRLKNRFSQGQYPLFHTDAVQAVGHLPINVKDLGVDFLSLSGHKFYGPKGVGALYIRKGIKIDSFMHGGEQEKGRRASTENVPGIVGLGVAAEIAAKNIVAENKELLQLRDEFIAAILDNIPQVRLNGHPTKRLPNNVNVSIVGVEGESMLLSLDEVGVACSTGSACSSSSLEPSHVLIALGLSPELAHSSLRFTFGRGIQKKDLDYAVQQLVKIVERLRKISPLK